MVGRVERRNDLHVRDNKNLNMYVFNRKNRMKTEKLRMKHIIKQSIKLRHHKIKHTQELLGNDEWMVFVRKIFLGKDT